MALTEAQEKALLDGLADLKAKNTEHEATIAELKKEPHAGYMKRVAGELYDEKEKAKGKPPDLKPGDKKPEGEKTAAEITAELDAKYEARDKALRDELDREKQRGKLSTALDRTDWFDKGVAEDYLLAKLKKNDKGQWVVPVEVNREGVGIVTKELSVEEAAISLVTEKKNWVRVKVTGGLQTGKARDGSDYTEPKTFQELIDNPNMLGHFEKTNPELVNRLEAQADAERLAKRNR